MTRSKDRRSTSCPLLFPIRTRVAILRRVIHSLHAGHAEIRAAIARAECPAIQPLAPGSYVSREILEDMDWLLDLDPGRSAPLLRTPPGPDGWRLEAVDTVRSAGSCRVRFRRKASHPMQPPAIHIALDGVFEAPRRFDWSADGPQDLVACLDLGPRPLVRLRVGPRSDGAFVVIADTT